MLHYDYYDDFVHTLDANGHRVPRVPSYMLAKCWERNNCYFGPHQDEYIAD